MITVFLSHSNKDKKIASQLKYLLSEHNIQVFLAHEDIDGGTEWMGSLYKEIRDSNAFFILLTKNYHHSNYTDQETGMALILNKPILPICIDKTIPYGFASKIQGITCKFPFDKKTVTKIVTSTKKFKDEFNVDGSVILDDLSKRLNNATTYSESASLANLISKYKQFSTIQINKIAKAYLNNHEVYDSFIARPLLSQILAKNMNKINSSYRSRLIGNDLL